MAAFGFGGGGFGAQPASGLAPVGGGTEAGGQVVQSSARLGGVFPPETDDGGKILSGLFEARQPLASGIHYTQDRLPTQTACNDTGSSAART